MRRPSSLADAPSRMSRMAYSGVSVGSTANSFAARFTIAFAEVDFRVSAVAVA
jgi:hypothetical protein